MKEVKNTKNPTTKQMLNMASNLRSRYKKYSVVSISANVYESGYIETGYIIYIGNELGHLNFKSWSACQDKYFELMREETPNA